MTIDFTTKYLGRQLRSPLVVASSPLASELDVLRRIEELGRRRGGLAVALRRTD